MLSQLVDELVIAATVEWDLYIVWWIPWTFFMKKVKVLSMLNLWCGCWWSHWWIMRCKTCLPLIPCFCFYIKASLWWRQRHEETTNLRSLLLQSTSFHPNGLILGTRTTKIFVRIWDVKTRENVAFFVHFLAIVRHDGVKKGICAR